MEYGMSDCAVEHEKSKVDSKNLNSFKSMTLKELKLILKSQGNNPLKKYALEELKRRKVDLHF